MCNVYIRANIESWVGPHAIDHAIFVYAYRLLLLPVLAEGAR